MVDPARALGRFRRVVVWGHPLHSHTHSYVHGAFARAFEALGAETVWTDDPAVLDGLDLRGTLFVTEGQVVAGMPLRSDCRYVVHNVAKEVTDRLAGSVLALQVLTRAAPGEGVQRLDAHTYFRDAAAGGPVLYQPWATDLLPSEFDFDVPAPRWPDPAAKIVWVGTIGAGEFGNVEQLAGFRRACEEAGVEFLQRSSVGYEENRELIRASLLAPAIVGAWQLEHGYVPCRIFKNISYGRHGLTNSSAVQDVFEVDLACDVDTHALFELGTGRVRERAALIEQMREVQARHTYVQRIARILECLP